MQQREIDFSWALLHLNHVNTSGEKPGSGRLRIPSQWVCWEREFCACHVVNYYSKTQVDKREVRGLCSRVCVSKMTLLRSFQFNPRSKQLLRASGDGKRKGKWAVSEEAGSLSPSGSKEEAKGFNWILNCISSHERFRVHCGLLWEHDRQLRFQADLYQMVVGLLLSVTEKG